MMPETGKPAPAFCLPGYDEQPVCLDALKGRWVVLYFYPKDNTSGCTLEAMDFTRLLPEFKALNAEILGISPDSSASHCRFRDKHSLEITLLSDEKHQVLKAYHVWGKKKMAGREYEGVRRSTFLVGPDGLIASSWTGVKVKGHAEAVLETLQKLR